MHSDGDAFLATVLDFCDDAIFGIDATGAVIRWNRAARGLFGYEDADAVGRPMATLFADHRRSEGQAWVERALHGEGIERADTDIRRRDGLVVPVCLTIAPVSGPGGQTVAAVVVRDVSEQKLAAATLAESEERLRESEVLADTGAWLWDGDELVQWSDGMNRIHGVDPVDFGGTVDDHFALVCSDDRPAAETQVRQALAQGRSFETEYRVDCPDGTRAWVYVRGQPVVDGLGRPQGIAGIYQDVSERRRAEQDRRLLSEAQQRQLHAREINDEIVQRLVVAQLAFELGEHDRANDALQSTLSTARRLVTSLLGDGSVEPGSLRRSAPAESI